MNGGEASFALWTGVLLVVVGWIAYHLKKERDFRPEKRKQDSDLIVLSDLAKQEHRRIFGEEPKGEERT